MAAASRSVTSQDTDRETSPPPPPNPPLPTEKTTVSKYQSKKAKKQVHVDVCYTEMRMVRCVVIYDIFVAREGSEETSQISGQEETVAETTRVLEHSQQRQ